MEVDPVRGWGAPEGTDLEHEDSLGAASLGDACPPLNMPSEWP